MHLKDLKQKSPADLVAMAEELGIEGASTLRKQELMFSILKVQAENGEEIMGMGTIEVLPDGFGFLRSPEANYLAGPDDIYVSPNQVRKFGLQDRRHGRGRDPRAQGRRALFRARPPRPGQFRRSRGGPPPRQFRQPHPALSRREAHPRQRRPDRQGQVGAGDRHHLAAGQGPARADRRAAADRQDRAAPEHRQGDHRQPSRGVPDRAADRRAARGSHRHAALGEGRGHLLDLRRAGAAATSRSPRW